MDDGDLVNVPDAELDADIEQDDCENENDEVEVLDDDNNDDPESKNDDDDDEDDDDYTFGSDIKYMKDCAMKKLLQLKVPLIDGSLAPLFSRGPKYSNTCWPVNCHLCLQGNILGVKAVRRHLISDMHKKMIQLRGRDLASYNKPLRQRVNNNPALFMRLRIFPGEIIADVLPRYKRRIIKIDETKLGISDIPKYQHLTNAPIDEAKLEKVALLRQQHPIAKREKFEMQEESEISFLDHFATYCNESEPLFGLNYAYKMKRFDDLAYFCGLCEKNIVGDPIFHFRGRPHVDKYSQINFPNTLNKLKTIFEELKLKYGSSLEPKRAKYFRAIIKLIYAKIEKKFGRDEMKIIDGFDFEVDRFKYIDEAMKANHYDENTIAITDEDLKGYFDQVLADDPLPAFATDVTIKMRRRERAERKAKAKLEFEKKRAERVQSRRQREEIRLIHKDSKEFSDKPDVLDRYSRMIGATMDDLEDQYKRYENDPESHPDYTVEWKKYWHNRADELEKDNIDPHTYDFNSEWMPYWIKRLQELHAKDIVKQKMSIKKKLKMSLNARSPSPVRRKNRTRSISPPRQKRLRSPSPPRRSRTTHQKPRTDTEMASYQSLDDEKLSVLSVLRLVTALEDQLGSLGPQAIQLLSRAVMSNKNNSNPNDLLMENDTYIFLITAREKFKGQLLARIVEGPKIHAVSRAVQQITEIVDMFEENKAQNSNSNFVQNDGDGGGASNQYTDNTSSFNNELPNQYRSENQAGVWQSGAYRGGGYNNGPNNNNQNLTTGSNYRGVNNRTNNQPAPMFGGGSNENRQMDNADSYSNRASGAIAPLLGNAMTSQRNENNGSGSPQNNAGFRNRNSNNNGFGGSMGGGPNRNSGPNRMSGPNRNAGPNRMADQINNPAGRNFNQGYNNRGRNSANPTSTVSLSNAYQMGNNANANLDSGMGGGQMNTGYNQSDNSNNNFQGQAPDNKLGGAKRSSFYSGDNNFGGRMNTQGNGGFGQNSMGNFGNNFSNHPNQMNFQNNRNSM